MKSEKATTLGNIIKPCLHCGKNLSLDRWDSWNGFLVRCPNCGGLHGKHWRIRNILFASILFNALSFPFTMRPRYAIIAVFSFVIFALVGNFLLLDRVSDIVALVGVSIFMLGPTIINAAVLVKHEHDLDQSVPPLRNLQTQNRY